MRDLSSFSVREAAGASVLSGAISGRRVLGKMAERIVEPAQPTVLHLDFQGIEVATASFLRGAVFDFRDLLRSNRSKLYSVVTNANDLLVEELAEVAKFKNDALLICLRAKGKPTHSYKLIGQLESKQQLTFDLVNKLREADVSKIVLEAPHEERIGKTAWNNRLSALESRGLIMELSRGRTKLYRSISSGAIDGN